MRSPRRSEWTSGCQLYLTTSGGDKFYQYTSANIGKSMAIVLDNTVREVATINGAIRDQGVIEGGGITKKKRKTFR